MNDTRLAIPEITCQTGETLDRLSKRSPILVVFLRHSGCVFCKRALADIAAARQEIEQSGVKIALVHMMDDASAERMFAKYGVEDLPRFADPDRSLYAAFDVARGTGWQVMGARVWGAAIRGILAGHLPSVPHGDVFQLPGTVIFSNGRILRRFDAKTSADRPDYVELACGPME